MTGQLLALAERAAAPGDAPTRALARLHLFDALMAASAGTATPEGARARRHLGGPGALARDGTGLHAVSPADIVFALARLIRVTELDDLQLESVTTAAAAAVPALAGALAVTGSREHGADDVLDAVAAGYDVMSALGLAVGGPDFLYRRGGWPSLAVAAPAAAATAGRLLGLDADGIAHALALAALSTPQPLRGRGEDGRWLSFASTVTSGFHAALAVAGGSRGDLGLFERDRARGVSARDLFPGLPVALARPWAPGRGLASAHLKQWASAGQVAAAIDAAGALHDARGFAPADVLAVDVHVPPAYRPMIDQPTGDGRMWSLVSAQYQIAARLLHPQDRFDCARSVLRDSARFRRLMTAVRVHEDERLASSHPHRYPARVAVTLRGGATAEFLSDGRSPAPHWAWPPLLAKARSVAAQAGTERHVDVLHAAVTGFADSAGLMSAVLPLLA